MKTKLLRICLAAALLFGGPTCLKAQTVQPDQGKQAVVIVNGKVLDNPVVSILFVKTADDGMQTRHYTDVDMARLVYQDSTYEDVALPALRIMFSNPLGVDRLPVFKGFAVQGEELLVEGLPADEAIRIFDLGGLQLLQTQASDGQTRIGLSTLPQGSYLFQSASAVFKFMKH